MAAAPHARAADVDFRPVLTFGLYHDGNVQIIGSTAVGDDSAAAAVDLPVHRTTENSALAFLYQARYVWYRKNGDLDYFGNTLSLNYSQEVSRRTHFQVAAGATRTDYQGITSASPDQALTFVPRTTLTRAFANVGGAIGLAERSLLDWEVRVGSDHYDDVPGVTFNNAFSAGARTGWRYEVSERSTIGLALSADWFDFQVGDDYVSETLVLTGTHKTGRSMSLAYDVGISRTSTTAGSSTEGRLLVSFTRELSQTSHLTAGARQWVTSGNGLQAATTDSGAWISYAQSSERNGLTGSIDGAYWVRKGVPVAGTTTLETETFNVFGALGWRFGRFVSLNGAASYVYQNDRSGTAAALNTRYVSYGLFLRWGIRGLDTMSGPRGRGSRGA
jgi:hypothetical protein